MVFQPTCLYFMVQFQEIEYHTNKIPFYRNFGISSGQESAEVHILLNRGECALHHWMMYLETSARLTLLPLAFCQSSFDDCTFL